MNNIITLILSWFTFQFSKNIRISCKRGHIFNHIFFRVLCIYEVLKMKLTFYLYFFSCRNIQQQILLRLCRRIRCRDPSWSWSWSSSAPWWWTGLSTSERRLWARSSSRSSWYLGSTVGCSLSCLPWQRSKNSIPPVSHQAYWIQEVTWKYI